MLPSAVVVSETWLDKSNSDLFNIPGYHFISNSRENKLGGGVGLYIQSDLNFKPRTDLQSSDKLFIVQISFCGNNVTLW